MPTPPLHGPSYPSSSNGEEPACNAGDLGSIPGLGRSPGEANGNPLQYSCLENSIETGAWWATVHGLQRVRHDCVAISISIGIKVDDFSPIINLFPKLKKNLYQIPQSNLCPLIPSKPKGNHCPNDRYDSSFLPDFVLHTICNVVFHLLFILLLIMLNILKYVHLS